MASLRPAYATWNPTWGEACNLKPLTINDSIANKKKKQANNISIFKFLAPVFFHVEILLKYKLSAEHTLILEYVLNPITHNWIGWAECAGLLTFEAKCSNLKAEGRGMYQTGRN